MGIDAIELELVAHGGLVNFEASDEAFEAGLLMGDDTMLSLEEVEELIDGELASPRLAFDGGQIEADAIGAGNHEHL